MTTPSLAPKIQSEMEVDLIAVGSGMGASCAALAAQAQGLETVILEKSDRFGGGTTYSYGIVWVGDNHLEKSLGIEDSREDAYNYLHHLAAGHELESNLRAYIDTSPEALRFFCDDVGIPFYVVPGFPDYFQGMAPGSLGEGRNLQVRPFEAKSLGAWQEHLRAAPAVTHRATFEEVASWGGRARPQNWDRQLIRERMEKDIRTFGAGLIGHLMSAVLRRNIPFHLETQVQSLVLEDGRVRGVIAKQGRNEIRIMARRGVVLATGSNIRNEALTRRFSEIHATESLLPPSVDGDSVVMAGEIGAAISVKPMFQQDLLYVIPGEEHYGVPLYRGVTNNESGFPHSILVNLDGNRFADESIGQQVGATLRNFDVRRHRYVNVPCFLVFDQTYLDKYGLGSIQPGQDVPDWLIRNRTVKGLAQEMGIDGEGLSKTIRRFNRFAVTGKDQDFGRGEFPFANSVSGDLTHEPNPNLGALNKPPYYGLPLEPAATGSTGLMTNESGQVLHLRGQPIPGLYACGSASSHYYGIGYQAGCELGGAMTFGYLAARHAAAE
ncbi:MAG: FAD-dependent oxidoreductase [Chloroflexi bacterium]|nr:FAD-dependent oxidoreductase [Chloroflexota bacterium]